MSYTLTDNNELAIDYRATTDKPTVCNLAHHSYFNLAGHNSGDILDTSRVRREELHPGRRHAHPDRQDRAGRGHAVRLHQGEAIGPDLEKPAASRSGYDLNYVLDKGQTRRPSSRRASPSPKSGRVLEVFTTEPGLQFYTGNFLDGTFSGPMASTISARGSASRRSTSRLAQPSHLPQHGTEARPDLFERNYLDLHRREVARVRASAKNNGAGESACAVFASLTTRLMKYSYPRHPYYFFGSSFRPHISAYCSIRVA